MPEIIAKLGRFNRVESVLACAKAVKHVVASGVARVDSGALVPISAINLNRIGHADLRATDAQASAGFEYISQSGPQKSGRTRGQALRSRGRQIRTLQLRAVAAAIS